LLLLNLILRDNDVMKPTEQLVAAIRELRFAIDRISEQELREDDSPAARSALTTQLQALNADVERLLEQVGAISESDAFEKDFVG
jgi:hypothetical protein